MTVDVAALRKFQEVWGPVLEAIPAVIEAVAKQDDLVRITAEQQKAVDKAKQEIASAYEQADRRLQAANDELDKIAEQKAKTQEAIESQRNAADEAASQAKAQAQANLDAIKQKTFDASLQLNSVEAEYAAKLADAKSAHAAAVAEMEAEIKSLESRKVQAEKALETLRAKLG